MQQDKQMMIRKKSILKSMLHNLNVFPLENIEIHYSYVNTYFTNEYIHLKIMCCNILDSMYTFTSSALKSFSSVLLGNFFTAEILIFDLFYFFSHYMCNICLWTYFAYASLSSLDGLFYFFPNFCWSNCKRQNLTNNFCQRKSLKDMKINSNNTT